MLFLGVKGSLCEKNSLYRVVLHLILAFFGQFRLFVVCKCLDLVACFESGIVRGSFVYKISYCYAVFQRHEKFQKVNEFQLYILQKTWFLRDRIKSIFIAHHAH